MRLDKFLTNNSQLSRSQAKTAIKAGQIKVNAVLVKQANFKLLPTDKVSYLDQPIKQQEELYLVLNKPVGYECSKAPTSHPSVFSLLGEMAQQSNLNPVGRLDVATSGLLLLTTDGQWLHQLTHPSKQLSKTYLAELAQPLEPTAQQILSAGIQLKNEAKPCLPAKLTQINSNLASLTITEGRYHQVRRMFAALNNRVVNLERISFAGLNLNELNLPVGQSRQLTPAELEIIKYQLN